MHPNLVDHLAAFIAIAEASSFSQGAREMNCSVSSMSYSLARLEEQCGFPLLKRGNGPTELTAKGRALFREAQAVVESARRFEAHSRSLGRGEETRIRMAVDVLFPSARLLAALSTFAAQHAHVTLQVFATSLNCLWEDLRSGAIDFGLSPLRDVPPDIEGKPFTSIELAPVAASNHPLAKRGEPLSLLELRQHRQLYYVGSPGLDVERRGRVFSTDVWTANDLELIRSMIKNGFGWAFATEHFFQEEIAAGQIVQLDCSDAHLQLRWPIGIVWHIDRPPGPLGRELLKSLTDNSDLATGATEIGPRIPTARNGKGRSDARKNLPIGKVITQPLPRR